MNILNEVPIDIIVQIIGHIGAFLLGATSLEVFWYERRRRKHRREEIDMDIVWKAHAENDTEHCPFSDEYDEEMKRRKDNPSRGRKN